MHVLLNCGLFDSRFIRASQPVAPPCPDEDYPLRAGGRQAVSSFQGRGRLRTSVVMQVDIIRISVRWSSCGALTDLRRPVGQRVGVFFNKQRCNVALKDWVAKWLVTELPKNKEPIPWSWQNFLFHHNILHRIFIRVKLRQVKSTKKLCSTECINN